MSRASKRTANKNIDTYLGDSFVSLMSLLKGLRDAREFVQDFFTEEEKIMLSKRLMLYIMLHNGYQASQIKSALGLSRETIRVHKNAFNNSSLSYKKIIKLIADKQKVPEVWKMIESLLKPLNLIMHPKKASETKLQRRRVSKLA